VLAKIVLEGPGTFDSRHASTMSVTFVRCGQPVGRAYSFFLGPRFVMRPGVSVSISAAVASLAFVLSACSQTNVSAVPTSHALTTHIVSPNATGTLVYACGPGAAECVWFPLHSNTIAGSINIVNGTAGMSVDSLGNVYVASSYEQSVVVYPKGSPTASMDLSDPGEDPWDVAVALDGTVYVANARNTSGGRGSISVYTGGTLKRIISDPNFQTVDSLSIDEHHLLIVCYQATSFSGCDEFPNARGSGVTVISGLGTPGGVKFDKNENIVVVDRSPGTAFVYPPGGGTPCNSIPLSGSPNYIAFDRPQTHLFYADSVNNDIVQETYPGCSGNATVVFTYNTGWTPTGVTVDLGPNP
jgi:hypothetical protein